MKDPINNLLEQFIHEGDYAPNLWHLNRYFRSKNKQISFIPIIQIYDHSDEWFSFLDIAMVFFNGQKSSKFRYDLYELLDFSGFFGFLKKCLTHKPWPKVYVEELEAQHWTAWGWDIIKREKTKIFTKNVFFFNLMTFFNFLKKFSKSHFFRKSDFFSKIDFFEKSDFLKIFDFWKMSSDFVSWVFLKNKSFFYLFTISREQSLKVSMRNSYKPPTYEGNPTRGGGATVRQRSGPACRREAPMRRRELPCTATQTSPYFRWILRKSGSAAARNGPFGYIFHQAAVHTCTTCSENMKPIRHLQTDLGLDENRGLRARTRGPDPVRWHRIMRMSTRQRAKPENIDISGLRRN